VNIYYVYVLVMSQSLALIDRLNLPACVQIVKSCWWHPDMCWFGMARPSVCL